MDPAQEARNAFLPATVNGGLTSGQSVEEGEAGQSTVNFFSQAYNGCIDVFSQAYNGCIDIFSRLYNGCKNVWSRLYNGCKDVLSLLYNGWRRLLLDTWFVEAIAIVFSAGCFSAIVAILYTYHGKASPQLPYGLTLNAIVSILSTTSKVALLFVVAGALGQLKWVWFSNQRPLEDMQLYDDATRGLLGSCSLLICLHIKAVASIGAAITMLALAYQPFVQQVLKYSVENVSHQRAEAAVPKASIYGAYYNDGPFASAVNSGLWDFSDNFNIAPPCPSGNCTWPAFRSVGWCSKCANVTTSASISDCNLPAFWNESVARVSCNISLGGGATATVVRGTPYNGSSVYTQVGCTTSFGLPDPGCEEGKYPTNSRLLLAEAKGLVWVLHDLRDDKYTYPIGHDIKLGLRNRTVLGVQNPVVAFAHAAIDDSPPTQAPRVKAAEACVLTLCEREYSVVVSNGEPTISITAVNYGYVNVATMQNSVQAVCWQAQQENVTYDYTPYVGYGVHNLSKRRNSGPKASGHILARQQPLAAHFWTNTTRNAFCPVDAYVDYISHYLVGTALKYCVKDDNQPVCRDLNMEVPGLTHAMGLGFVVDRVAASLTKLGNQVSNETVIGNVIVSEVHLHVRWVWLTLPAALEGLSLLFFGMAMKATCAKKAPLWKSSIFPLIFSATNDRERQNAVGVGNISSMEKDSVHMATIGSAGARNRVLTLQYQGNEGMGRELRDLDAAGPSSVGMSGGAGDAGVRESQEGAGNGIPLLADEHGEYDARAQE